MQGIEGRSDRAHEDHRTKGFRCGPKRSLFHSWDGGWCLGAADCRSPQALAASLPAGSRSQGPAHLAPWPHSSPARGPLCRAWTWNWWAAVTACHW